MSDPTLILKHGIEQGLHPGAELFVSHHGKTVIDYACGQARPNVPMEPNTLVQWFSSGKPLTAICIAQLYEAGDLLLEDLVTRFIPEFGVAGKEGINLRHLLTHTGGFREADAIPRHTEWPEAIRKICATPLEADWTPGEKAGYSTQAAWFILAEIIQRISGAPFPEFVRRQVLSPLDMVDTWLSLSPDRFISYGIRIAQMFDTSRGALTTLAPLQDAVGMSICRPGASARGPAAELARFYRMLLCEGELGGRRLLRPETVALFVKRHRIGLFDHTFAHKLDYGLGFILNSSQYGADSVPYGYGRYASPEAFGHSGAQSSCAFADPHHGLVVAWVANGMPGERAHQERQRAVNNAIYEALGLC